MLKRLALLSTIGLSIVLLTSAYLSDTGRAGKTGSPGETTCVSCHGDFSANSGGGSVSLAGITGGTYTPGTTYNLSVTVSRTGSTVFGLGCEALTAAGANAGTLIITNASETHLLSATISGNSRTSVTHQLNGGASNNTHTFAFNWTAPSAGTGTVTLYYAGIAGDRDGSEAGDYVYNGSMTLTEAAGCTAPAQPGAISGAATTCSGQSQTYSVAAVTGATSYAWTLPSGWTGSSSTNSITTTAGTTSGTISVTASNACGTSAARTLSVTSNASVTPSVSIASGAGNTICSGSSVTFTASPTNGGSTPSYQWKVNGSIVGTNSATFTTSALTNGAVVTCVMTSNANCASSATATSNAVTMNVNSSSAPAVSIVSNAGSSICAGSSVTFTASPVNGGSSPAYQWKVNGSNVGSNSASYSSNSLVNGDQVSCMITSNSACASTPTANSNVITISVTSSFTASINAGGPTTFCQGGQVVLTASAGDSYVWSPGGAVTQSITVTAGGNYSVTVTSGTCSATSAPTDVVVDAGPSVSISSIAPVCSTDAVITLSGGSPAGGTYEVDGVPATSFDPATATLGNHTVSYSVSGGSGCTGTASTTLTVNDCSAGSGNCSDFFAYSQNEWGTSGGAADSYLQNNFAGAFPNGIRIGDCGRYLDLTSATAVADFLPSNGNARPLRPGTLVDPGTSYRNSLAGELVAMYMNIVFDSLDANFGPSNVMLKNAIIASGSFSGWTVNELLTEANHVIGCVGSNRRVYRLLNTMNEVNRHNIASADNGGNDDGDDEGDDDDGEDDDDSFLLCPGDSRVSGISREVTDGLSITVFPNPSQGIVYLNYELVEEGTANILVYDLMGRGVFQQTLDAQRSGEFTTELPLVSAGISDGIYMVRIINGNRTADAKLMLFR